MPARREPSIRASGAPDSGAANWARIGRALGALHLARPSSFHGNPPDLPRTTPVGAEVDEFASGVPGGAVVAAGVGGEAGGFVRVAEVEEVDVVVGVGVGVVAAAVGDEGNAVAVLAPDGVEAVELGGAGEIGR